MKKVLSFLAVCLTVGVISLSQKPAEAQSAWGAYCCDGDGARRCVLDRYYWVGTACVCFGQGNGWVCP